MFFWSPYIYTFPNSIKQTPANGCFGVKVGFVTSQMFTNVFNFNLKRQRSHTSRKSWSTAQHFHATRCLILGQIASQVKSKILREQKWEFNRGSWSEISCNKGLGFMKERRRRDLQEAKSSPAKRTLVRSEDCRCCTHSSGLSATSKLIISYI